MKCYGNPYVGSNSVQSGGQVDGETRQQSVPFRKCFAKAKSETCIVGRRVNLFVLGQASNALCCEHVKKPSSSLQGIEFIDYLSHCQLVKRDSATWKISQTMAMYDDITGA